LYLSEIMKKNNNFIEIESNFKRVEVDLANMPENPSLRKKYEKKKIIKKIMPPIDEIPRSTTDSGSKSQRMPDQKLETIASI
jgi:hypothetical protein